MPYEVIVIFQGSKNFWRSKTNLELTVGFHPLFQVFEIIAVDPANTQAEQRIYVDFDILRDKLDHESLERETLEEQAKYIEQQHQHQQQYLDLDAIEQKIAIKQSKDYIMERLALEVSPLSSSEHKNEHASHWSIALQPTAHDTVDPESGKLDILCSKPLKLEPFANRVCSKAQNGDKRADLPTLHHSGSHPPSPSEQRQFTFLHTSPEHDYNMHDSIDSHRSPQIKHRSVAHSDSLHNEGKFSESKDNSSLFPHLKDHTKVNSSSHVHDLSPTVSGRQAMLPSHLAPLSSSHPPTRTTSPTALPLSSLPSTELNDHHDISMSNNANHIPPLSPVPTMINYSNDKITDSKEKRKHTQQELAHIMLSPKSPPSPQLSPLLHEKAIKMSVFSQSIVKASHIPAFKVEPLASKYKLEPPEGESEEVLLDRGASDAISDVSDEEEDPLSGSSMKVQMGSKRNMTSLLNNVSSVKPLPKYEEAKNEWKEDKPDLIGGRSRFGHSKGHFLPSL